MPHLTINDIEFFHGRISMSAKSQRNRKADDLGRKDNLAPLSVEWEDGEALFSSCVLSPDN